MIRSDKKLAELKKTLERGRHTEIEEIVSKLRDTEPFEGALKLLALFYDTSSAESLKLIISGFFNDIKEKSARQEVIESISEVESPSTKAMLASSCWQSGLDYSGHARALAEIFLDNDYMTALECFTVMDTCSVTISREDKEYIIKRLEKNITTHEKAKQQLTRELISVLKE